MLPTPIPPQGATHASDALRTARVIQGGMGAGVSGWQLARAVSLRSELGVVSGTGIDSLFVRRLQDGDPEGHLRRAAETFPLEAIARDALRRWHAPDGRAHGQPYRLLSLDGLARDVMRQRLIALATFVEVRLAKEGHDGLIGLNLLTKIQAPNLASLWGAMLAGVDVVLMGAGIPREIPVALDMLAEHRAASIRLDVEGLRSDESPILTFDPRAHGASGLKPLRRPLFLPIVASNLLANVLVKKSTGHVDGLVIEGPTAGGHVAPPRAGEVRNERGEPVYGERDVVALDKIAALGLPFWLAGGTGWPEKLVAALAAGATGVQVGTLFAFCAESGLREDLKRQVIDLAMASDLDVVTDPRASPTGFPFKVVQLPGSLSDDELRLSRWRTCDLGYLRTAFAKDGGGIGFRCPAEDLESHVAKGGRADDTIGRHCLCNALMANVGAGQLRDGETELPLLTSGDDIRRLREFLAGRTSYSASDVLDHVLS